jgi:hypothetical protein
VRYAGAQTCTGFASRADTRVASVCLVYERFASFVLVFNVEEEVSVGAHLGLDSLLDIAALEDPVVVDIDVDDAHFAVVRVVLETVLTLMVFPLGVALFAIGAVCEG